MQQSDSLYLLVNNFIEAEDKNETFELFFKKFEPLLTKYALKLGELDAKFLLSEALYEALIKMPVSLERFKENKFIVAYIQKAIYAEYIKISKFNATSRSSSLLDDDVLTSANINYSSSYDDFWYRNLISSINSVLTAEENHCFYMKFILGYSETEIAKMLSVSRQAVNKRVQKIRDKVKLVL